MAIVLEEVSTFTFLGTSYYAMAMCLFALLLEGVRSSAMWTVKMRVLNSRWRLLSYGTIFTSMQQFCCALSPFLCEFIARRHGASFLTTNQKELADAIVVSLAPIGILQFFAQALALPFVQKEFGMTVQSNRGYSNTLVMRLFRRSPLATSLATGGLLALGLWLVQRSLVGRRPPFTPYHRCSERHTCKVLETRQNTNFAKSGGSGFGQNEYGQYTTGKFNCRLRAHDHVQELALIARCMTSMIWSKSSVLTNTAGLLRQRLKSPKGLWRPSYRVTTGHDLFKGTVALAGTVQALL
ncbi:unnamed protein product [Prorocentrum cordatum]|uniref:Protein RFT1 homolog n=1 Tax=Prorocentrum cordatum TaxID=2364126 RepID=A0ABN9RD57_9DINO|nr:unnamed protein product [Polarella glacialis]